jgi:putative FmdB family regulatory protein
MPTYQYKCSNDHFYEEDRSIHSEEPIITCDECHEDMKKVFGSPSVNLVGRGFYRNGG